MPTLLIGFLTRAWNAVLDVFTSRSALEFQQFKTAPLLASATGGDRYHPVPAVFNVQPLTGSSGPSTNPAECEEAFTALLQDGRYADAWELMSPDSQASWESRETFLREMSARPTDRSIVASKVREVRLLPTWTDKATRRTHHLVAELVVDYHLMRHSQQTVVTRDVHLVNVRGGWKSLCYRY